jgi:hypothetical protein
MLDRGCIASAAVFWLGEPMIPMNARLNASKSVLAVLGLLCGALLSAPGCAFAQANQWDKPVDLKSLVPPVVPLPPNSRLNPSAVGGYQGPSTTIPLQNPNSTASDPAPGLKLTIPAR